MKRKNNGQYRKSYLGKLLLLLIIVVVGAGVIELSSTKSIIVNQTAKVVEAVEKKDPVDVYIEEKLNEYKKQLELEEKVIRSTLKAEDEYVEFQAKYKIMREKYASSTQEMSDRFDLLQKMELLIGYTEIAKKSGIKIIE